MGDIPAVKIPEFLLELSNTIEKSNLSFEEYLNSKKEEFKGILNKYAV